MQDSCKVVICIKQIKIKAKFSKLNNNQMIKGWSIKNSEWSRVMKTPMRFVDFFLQFFSLFILIFAFFNLFKVRFLTQNVHLCY